MFDGCGRRGNGVFLGGWVNKRREGNGWEEGRKKWERLGSVVVLIKSGVVWFAVHCIALGPLKLGNLFGKPFCIFTFLALLIRRQETQEGRFLGYLEREGGFSMIVYPPTLTL